MPEYQLPERFRTVNHAQLACWSMVDRDHPEKITAWDDLYDTGMTLADILAIAPHIRFIAETENDAAQITKALAKLPEIAREFPYLYEMASWGYSAWFAMDVEWPIGEPDEFESTHTRVDQTQITEALTEWLAFWDKTRTTEADA